MHVRCVRPSGAHRVQAQTPSDEHDFLAVSTTPQMSTQVCARRMVWPYYVGVKPVADNCGNELITRGIHTELPRLLTEGQEDNAMDHAMIRRSCTRDEELKNREDAEFTQLDCTQLCMFAVSGRDTHTGFKHKPFLANRTPPQRRQRLRCQRKCMCAEWFGLTMWASSLSLTIVEMNLLQEAIQYECLL